MKRFIQRYADGTRMNHWAVAMLFFCAALSGLAFFHPALYFFTMLFGGGPWTRILHPFFGVLMVLGFVLLFAKVWRENAWKPRDTEWLKAAPHLMQTGDEHGMPAVGKYNGGQKLVFWLFGISLLLLFVTGFVFWQPWFADYFAIPLRRIAVVVHAASAVVLVLSVIVHVYAAIWVKGTMRAMTRGTVTEAWARQNHPLWYQETTGKK
ncbi:MULTISPECIES: formate dehydrogenase subunit gamma [unclassified Rhizobacter]|uniref:formate dehydrogenase subunit gamma n=1 Tax=unclassified Rhizobacter TaxID=2640088 RepID=UPI0006F707CB|nr:MULTISPECIES: formate dehydrogenase subunit gamma [unclassified Rhizobacter]KQU74269.1 formate dehydrogenase [Rhizobacter sp. Root29]KQW03270.1 formate dehydrogenase [Rhizobacter sp. Root1238]KRB14015.1 formate dehydrogenase [Rhizobacter sp. Root16D2]